MKFSSKNRILMLLENQTYPRDFRVRREATALIAAGYRVSLICPADPGQPQRENLNGVRVYRYPAPPSANGLLGYLWEYGFSMLAAFALSLQLFFREGFDVVHAHNPPDTFVFIAAFYKLFGKRFVFDHHDLSPEMYLARFPNRGSKPVYKVLLFLEKLTCRLADHVIATNNSYKRIEMARDGVPENRITVVRNGIELHLALARKPAHAISRDGTTIIGYVGVMGFQDGVDCLLRAFHHLVHDLGRKDFLCVLVGDGAAFNSLKNMVEQFGLTQHVLFTGMVDQSEVSRYLSAADICVAPEPSTPYNACSTAVKVMEYMSLGKPIVAFDLTEHRYTAQEAAVYARPNDELELARLISELMDDPVRRKIMGEFGRSRIVTQLAWSFSIPLLLQAYRNVLPPPSISPLTLPQEMKNSDADPVKVGGLISGNDKKRGRYEYTANS